MLTLKETLFQQCEDFVNTRLQTIQTTISSHQKALSSETKSSAGDKNETGRAMLQLEMEKAGQQLAAVQQILVKINSSKITNTPLRYEQILENQNFFPWYPNNRYMMHFTSFSNESLRLYPMVSEI